MARSDKKFSLIGDDEEEKAEKKGKTPVEAAKEVDKNIKLNEATDDEKYTTE